MKTEKNELKGFLVWLVICVALALLAVFWGCDSTKVESVDIINLTISATVQVEGVREVGSKLTFKAQMPNSHKYDYKFAPDYTNDPGNTIHATSGVLDYKYNREGFYLVVAFGQDSIGGWLKSQALGITISKKWWL